MKDRSKREYEKFKFEMDRPWFRLFNKGDNLLLFNDNSIPKSRPRTFKIENVFYLNDKGYNNRVEAVIKYPSAIIFKGDVFIDFKPEQMDSDKEKGMINRLYNLEYGIKKIIPTRGGEVLEGETNYLLLLKIIRRELMERGQDGKIDLHNLNTVLPYAKMNLHNFSGLISQVENASERVNDIDSKINILSYLLNSLKVDTKPEFLSEEESLDDLIDKLSNLKIEDYIKNKRKLNGKNDRYLLEKPYNKEVQNSNDEKRSRVREQLEGLTWYLKTFKEGLEQRLMDFPENFYLTVKSKSNIVLRLRDSNVNLCVESGILHEEGRAKTTDNPRRIYLKADKDIYVKYV